MDHAPGSPSKYMTTIYNYFCMKMLFLDFLKVKNYENMLQNAPNCTIKIYFFSGKHTPGPGMVWYGNCLFDKIKSTLKHNSKYIISES